jgi:hypothetical protein
LLNEEPVFIEYYEPHLQKYIQIRAFPQFDENNEYKGIFHFVRDITHECILSENRSFKRVDSNINAEVTIDSKYYEGSIENLSEEGLFEIFFSVVEVTDFTPKKILKVKFHKPSGEDLDLKCKVVWLRLNRDNLARLEYRIGMEIISPPVTYKKYVKTL